MKSVDKFEQFEEEPLFLPPFLTGIYCVLDQYMNENKFHFRRMPRAAKYTGRFGLFFYDPDAHWQLIAVWDRLTTSWEKVSGLPVDVSAKLKIFDEPQTHEEAPKLIEHRCAWCGKSMPSESERFTHQSKACNRDPNPEGEIIEGACDHDTPEDYVHGSGIVGDSREYMKKMPF